MVRGHVPRSHARPGAGRPEIRAGRSTLLFAPTGSGKTLAAFLSAIDRLMFSPVPGKDARCRVLYVSPLRALAVDVERNLRAPLAGIARVAERRGEVFHLPVIGIRTGDTPAARSALGSCRPATTCARPISPSPTWDRVDAGELEDYWQADLTDAGSAVRARTRLRCRRAHGGDPAADPQPAARRLRQQHPEHVQRARGGDRSGCSPVRELLERDRARASSSPSGRSSPSTCPSTRSTRSGRRTRTRPRSGSASSSATERSSAPTSAARRSARAGSRTRGATSGTSARSSEIRPC